MEASIVGSVVVGLICEKSIKIAEEGPKDPNRQLFDRFVVFDQQDRSNKFVNWFDQKWLARWVGPRTLDWGPIPEDPFG